MFPLFQVIFSLNVLPFFPINLMLMLHHKVRKERWGGSQPLKKKGKIEQNRNDPDLNRRKVQKKYQKQFETEKKVL